MLILKIVLILTAGIIFFLQILPRVVSKLVRFPAPAHIGPFLDSAVRKLMQSPAKVIERSGLRKGMTVLDLGCGSGAYTTPAARALGPRGKVYSLDIQEKMLLQLKRKLLRPKNANIRNCALIRASAYELPLRSQSIDLCMMVTVLQEIPDRKRALAEIRRVLKPGGTLAVTEFFIDPDYPLKSTTTRLVEGEGFVLEECLGHFWNYTVRFKKPAEELS